MVNAGRALVLAISQALLLHPCGGQEEQPPSAALVRTVVRAQRDVADSCEDDPSGALFLFGGCAEVLRELCF